MRQNLEIYYDKEADILEVTLGTPSACIFEEIEDDVFEARDEATNVLKGYKIFNFVHRGGFSLLKKIKISLPAHVLIE